MNIKLRKRHRYMWFVIGIGLPLLCLEAIEAIPDRPTADIPRTTCPIGVTSCGMTEYDQDHFLEHDVFEMSTEAYDSSKVLKISFDRPLQSAFTLVYYSTKAEIDDSAVLLGSLAEMGSYEFPLMSDPRNAFNVILYDKLNQRQLFTANFTDQ